MYATGPDFYSKWVCVSGIMWIFRCVQGGISPALKLQTTKKRNSYNDFSIIFPVYATR